MAKVEKSAERRQPNRVSRFINESIAELKKVNWPTRNEAVNLTIIVAVVTVGMGALLGILDFLFSRLFAFIFSVGA